MTLESGQTLGSLVLRHKLADGGMGSVWVAEHVALGRDVAVKFLSEGWVDNAELLQRFTLEARTLARISCPHTPQVFDCGVAPDGTPYIVMELIAGVDLRTWVADWGLMSVPQAARLIDQVTQALTAAHGLGVIHRDIKPENIMLTGGRDDFHAVLIDFGIAKSLLTGKAASITQVGATLGSLNFMSPEQMAGSGVDERADMWSLAVVLYWCLTGKLPFEGEIFAVIRLAIQQGHVTPVTELRADLPQSLDEWFSRALASDADGRFESAELMSRMFNVAATASFTGTSVVTLGRRDRPSAKPQLLPMEMSFSEVTPSPMAPRSPARAHRRWTWTAALAGAVLAGGVIVTMKAAPKSWAWPVIVDSVVASAPVLNVAEPQSALSPPAPSSPVPPPPPPPSEPAAAPVEAPTPPPEPVLPAPRVAAVEKAAPSATLTRSRVSSYVGRAHRAPDAGAVRAEDRATAPHPETVAVQVAMAPASPPAAPASPPAAPSEDWTPSDTLGEP